MWKTEFDVKSYLAKMANLDLMGNINMASRLSHCYLFELGSLFTQTFLTARLGLFYSLIACGSTMRVEIQTQSTSS